MNVIAIDVSTKSGFCWSDSSARYEYRVDRFLKQKGDTVEQYAAELYTHVGAVCDLFRIAPPLVVLEDYAFGAQGRAKTLLGELGGVVKLALVHKGIHFITVTPTQWKAYVLGASHAKKEDIKTLVYKKFKQDFSDRSNDECDAYCMWLLGRELANPNGVRKNATAKFYELRDRVQEMLYASNA